MSDDATPVEPTQPASARPARRRIALVPRGKDQGYGEDDVAARRRWVEERTGASLDHVGRATIPAGEMRGNIENPIGAVQMPLGVAGPLLVQGEAIRDEEVYVPLATTEGAVVRSYERGMVALTRSGGATVRVWVDENRISPIFTYPDVAAARAAAERLPELFPRLEALAGSTTRHGRLLRLAPHPLGRRLTIDLCFSTGDAHGMNMISRAADLVCREIEAETGALGHLLFSGREAEKRATGTLLAGGKGKTVTAGARIPRRVVRTVLGTTAEALGALFRNTVLGHVQAGSVGHNAHIANGLTALFVATGQDVANVANSAVGITEMEASPEGDLLASVTLYSLVVATVGGGTGLPTSRECLEMLGCAGPAGGDGGSGKALRLAEIAAATVLAGEISFSAALTAGGGFVEAHEAFGRNRPSAAPTDAPAPDRASHPDSDSELPSD